MTTRPTVDFGHPSWQLRLPWLSLRVNLRIASVAIALICVSLIVSVVSLGIGDIRISAVDVAKSLTGTGSEFYSPIVTEWRLPIVLSGIVFGGLLGIGGAIFQSLTRNPLGSPDVIGFDAGSYTGVAVTVLVLGTASYWDIAIAALSGGLITAFAVYVLAYRGGITGFRLIIVGIALSAMLTAINGYLITRAKLEDAMVVGLWSAGSLSKVTWTSMAPSLVAAAVIVVAVGALSPALRRLELGDDTAITQGTRVGRTRLGLLVIGVATTALVTAAAGPISFVALAAPQLARRLTKSPGVSVAGSAAMGAALLSTALLLSLVIGQLYRPIPVGLLTVCIGGTYLIWLLTREARRQSGMLS
ncbi:FecCD family ABC transporter permease [Demetria terragena]|uniref:FecCD family ABC transporter permease n=1 Tax=Demetria terragena TaxID=63959 RepID=UPI00035F4FF4|nr:iron chelate uptake ABC transporter family permease subunit [Demetria terragena]